MLSAPMGDIMPRIRPNTRRIALATCCLAIAIGLRATSPCLAEPNANGAATRPTPDEDGLRPLQGSWQATAAVKEGEPATEEEVKSIKLVIEGDKMTLFSHLRAEGES